MKNASTLFYGLVLLSVVQLEAGESLTYSNINLARVYHQEKFNEGLPFGGSSMDFKLPTGELVLNTEIGMLAKWLYARNSLPSLRELDSILDARNTANRIFCWECLQIILKKKPDFNPYFPPGSEPEKIAKMRSIIRELQAGRQRQMNPRTK